MTNLSVVKSVDCLTEEASKATGLDDFGSEAWRDGLEVIVASANDEADLNRFGVKVLEEWIQERLQNRLRVVHWHREHPEGVTTPIARPIIIAGMLRTGTTILHELLSVDPVARSLWKWEALESVPPPRPDRPNDPRILRWIQKMEATYSLVPNLKAVHWEPGDGPTECVALLGQSFRSQDWFGLFHLPTYVEWYRHADFGPAYRYHRMALQLLGSEWSGRWTLKAPGHLLCLDEVINTYPDATLVITHRDPQRTVPSAVSLSATSLPDSLTNTLSTAEYWGPLWLSMLGEMVDRLVDFRVRRPEVDAYDIHFDQFEADPIATIAALYEHRGDPFTNEIEVAMRRYLADHQRGHQGHHEYSLADAGIAPGEVEERFAEYVQHFSIRPEVRS